jgi:hypothetical protein
MRRLVRFTALLIVAALVLQVSAELAGAGGPQVRKGKGRGVPRIVAVHQDIHVQPADDVRVRTKEPPLQFDDKGKPKPYTAQELRELKGSDPNLPGYAGDYSELKPGQIVRVHLSRNTAADREKPETRNAEPKWVAVGQLTGRVVRVDNRASTKTGKQKNTDAPKRKTAVPNELVVRVESYTLTRGGAKNPPAAKGKDDAKDRTLDDDVLATLIVVLQDAPLK